MVTHRKHRNPEQWLAARTGRKPSGPQDPSSPGENANPYLTVPRPLVHESGQSAGPSGRRQRAVNKGSLFGDDYDDYGGGGGDGDSKFSNRRREMEHQGEEDAEEPDFEADFVDDDEKYLEYNQDEEAEARN